MHSLVVFCIPVVSWLRIEPSILSHWDALTNWATPPGSQYWFSDIRSQSLPYIPFHLLTYVYGFLLNSEITHLATIQCIVSISKYLSYPLPFSKRQTRQISHSLQCILGEYFYWEYVHSIKRKMETFRIWKWMSSLFGSSLWGHLFKNRCSYSEVLKGWMKLLSFIIVAAKRREEN